MGLLEKKIEPDIEGLLEVIQRRSSTVHRTPHGGRHRAEGKRVYHIELFLDEEIRQQVCARFDLATNLGWGERFAELKRDIELHAFLGYDAFRFGLRSGDVFKLPHLYANDTTGVAAQSRGQREWSEEHAGPIRSWQDFESYPWPEVCEIDFGPLEWLQKNLPENMGCYELTAHILEVTSWLFGYETFCYKIFDEADLVDAVFQKVGMFYEQFTRTLCDFSCVRLIWGSDDMGFRTSTLVSVEVLREKVLPWHKRCAQIAHEHNRPYLLHSCGNLEEIMDDLINDVGIDAKHSFEDAIMPVTEAKKKYGDRIALLGGLDVDFLCRADEQAIRKRVRETLATCLPGGGYCLGTGNTVANYIPLDNYLIMLDEGRKFLAG